MCFSCKVQPSAETWVVSALEPDQIRQFCLVKGVLLDLVGIGCVQDHEAVVAARKWSVFSMNHRFPGLWV